MFERFSGRARAVLVDAQEEARDLDHNFIGTEHLMLGVVRSSDPVVTQCLAGYDFTLEDLRERVLEIVGRGDEAPTAPPPFTPRAKKVLELSLREAIAMGHDHIGPAHILLGILREGDGVGAKVLGDLGVDYDRARLWIGQQIGEQPHRGRRRRRMRGIEQELSAQSAHTAAASPLPLEARALAETEMVGTQHYLLAMLAKPESMAGKVLDSFGVTRDKVEAKIAEIGLENTSDAPPKPPSRPQTVQLAEGVEVRISDPELGKLVESGDLEALLKEVIRRAQPES